MCPDEPACENDFLGFLESNGSFQNEQVIGLAKDGHIMYGPKNSSGELWSCSDHDICNGKFMDDGSYAYISTNTHPYLIGCWGPAAD
mmetsp:Transcript_4029/g.2732  ORF Transcript_4029/g.2732 Transcript_4029/m.2732 type:complete len:87 (+) Transcript_4029:802-1062(+)|eukprot:CAMPEP_0116877486 /NCGR_PEP_ID=MMETSP0463-20121206/9273_1 /TAXON_ID=181622 /ORGANISM="Strombidinopsis sp, Strain SopsisLIS2011" /LENGTH=86 /DNA_ID=CAMNT_0004524829 /DNA_START=802 /DNA_END=1062 /DNA_ORIENTATION=-